MLPMESDPVRFGMDFRDTSWQGHKFGIDLTVISQHVSEIDKGVLTQLNTELFMFLGYEIGRKEAIRDASDDLLGFERELKIISRDHTITSASYRNILIPIQAPHFFNEAFNGR